MVALFDLRVTPLRSTLLLLLPSTFGNVDILLYSEHLSHMFAFFAIHSRTVERPLEAWVVTCIYRYGIWLLLMDKGGT